MTLAVSVIVKIPTSACVELYTCNYEEFDTDRLSVAVGFEGLKVQETMDPPSLGKIEEVGKFVLETVPLEIL